MFSVVFSVSAWAVSVRYGVPIVLRFDQIVIAGRIQLLRLYSKKHVTNQRQTHKRTFSLASHCLASFKKLWLLSTLNKTAMLKGALHCDQFLIGFTQWPIQDNFPFKN